MKTLVLWFTGLSGSGKTTMARAIGERLVQEGKKVKIIDGDVVRATVHKDLKFTPQDIKENNRLIALMCRENIGQWDYILVPIISPFRESRGLARQMLAGHFVEVYVKTDLHECIKRDTKGLYKKALEGKIDNFIGISPQTPYEPPENPEIIIDTASEDVSAAVEKVLGHIR